MSHPATTRSDARPKGRRGRYGARPALLLALLLGSCGDGPERDGASRDVGGSFSVQVWVRSAQVSQDFPAIASNKGRGPEVGLR